MIDGIDAVDWKSLAHSHASAEEVPSQLRALASTSESAQARALSYFWGYLVHQGTRYEASSYVVPFLFEILENAQPKLQRGLINLLLGLAFGLDESFLPNGYDLPQEEQKFQENQWDGILAYPEARRAFFEVHNRSSRFLAYVASDVQPEVRLTAVYAVAHFAQVLSTDHRTVINCIEDESDEIQLANLLLCYGMLARFSQDEPDLRILSDRLHADSSSLRRVAAAIAMTTVRGPDSPQEAIDVLLTALKESWQLDDAVRQRLQWNEGDIIGYAALVLRLLGPERRDEVANALCAALVRTDVCTFAMSQTLLDILFPGPDPEAGRRVADFDDVQRTSLRTLLQTQHWRSWMLTGKFLQYGLTGDDYFRAFDAFVAEVTGEATGSARDISRAGNVSSWHVEQPGT